MPQWRPPGPPRGQGFTILTPENPRIDQLREQGIIVKFEDDIRPSHSVEVDGSIVIRLPNGGTTYELEHELAHLQHFRELGENRAIWDALGRTTEGIVLKEIYVWDQIRKSNPTPEELAHANQVLLTYLSRRGGYEESDLDNFLRSSNRMLDRIGQNEDKIYVFVDEQTIRDAFAIFSNSDLDDSLYN